VATISTAMPASRAAMARDQASCPVEQPADQSDGQGPGFLSGRPAGGPDLDRLAASGLAEGGQKFLAEGVETDAVAPEPGLGIQQGFDHGPAQAGDGFGPERTQHGIDGLEPLAPGDRPQPVLGQFHPVARQPKARARDHQ